MNMKQAIIATVGAVLVALACGDVPAGTSGGDSAGDNQPNNGEQCLAPQEIDIELMGYVQADGLTYTASAYLMDGECDMIEITGENLLKITLVAIDSRGSRMDPKLDSSPQASPFGATILFALPIRYSIELVATGNMNRNQVKDSETLFIGCALIPVGKGKGPVDVQISDIGAGKGKVSCRVAA